MRCLLDLRRREFDIDYVGQRSRKTAHSKITSTDHIESPMCQPSITLLCGNWQDLVLQQLFQTWSVIAFVHSRHSDSKLDVFQLCGEDVCCIFDSISKEEECCCIFCRSEVISLIQCSTCLYTTHQIACVQVTRRHS